MVTVDVETMCGIHAVLKSFEQFISVLSGGTFQVTSTPSFFKASKGVSEMS